MTALIGFLVLVLILIIVVIALRALFGVLGLPSAVQTIVWCIVAVIVLVILFRSYGPSLTAVSLPH